MDIPKTPEGIVQAIADHIDGWRSATFGWQDDPDPVKARRNQQFAIQAHAAECIRRIRDSLAALSAEGVGSEPRFEFDSLEKVIDEFIADYEMIGESEDGRDACYQPNDNERILIKDAILGLLAHDEWDAEWGRLIAQRAKESAAPTAPAGGEAPVAWVDGAALRFLADPKRGPNAYILTSLNVSDPKGTRTPLYTHPSADLRGAQADAWLLQDTRSYVGNDMLFWAESGKGYTTDVSKAQVYTREEAYRQHAIRDTDRPWPLAYIRGKTRPAVDFQYVEYDAAIASLEAAISRKGKTE